MWPSNKYNCKGCLIDYLLAVACICVWSARKYVGWKCYTDSWLNIVFEAIWTSTCLILSIYHFISGCDKIVHITSDKLLKLSYDINNILKNIQYTLYINALYISGPCVAHRKLYMCIVWGNGTKYSLNLLT